MRLKQSQIVSQQRKSQDQIAAEFYQNLKEKLKSLPRLLKLFHKTEREGILPKSLTGPILH
jgi:hypothetical protein